MSLETLTALGPRACKIQLKRKAVIMEQSKANNLGLIIGGIPHPQRTGQHTLFVNGLVGIHVNNDRTYLNHHCIIVIQHVFTERLLCMKFCTTSRVRAGKWADTQKYLPEKSYDNSPLKDRHRNSYQVFSSHLSTARRVNPRLVVGADVDSWTQPLSAAPAGGSRLLSALETKKQISVKSS